MNHRNPFSSATLVTRHSIGRFLERRSCLPVVLAIVWITFAPSLQAVTPPPDGGYPNQNTAEGEDTLVNLTTGIANTAIGFNALFSNTTGIGNTATGFEALFSNTTGGQNTANGAAALFSNTIGHDNTAAGVNALFSNNTGVNNTATGSAALIFNTTGGSNTATGTGALFSNTTGSENTATGAAALVFNTTGHDNTANGFDALISNSTGSRNTADGVSALSQSTTGNSNTADGFEALRHNTEGELNTASGFRALLNNTTGHRNIAFGPSAGAHLTTGSNNIDIGNIGVAGESATIRIGAGGTHMATFIAGIRGVTVPTGVGVIIGSNGQLGSVVSSARFKQDIKAMDKASEAILALKPVTFRYKEELDPEHIPQFGLVAEQVEKVDPDLVVRDADGKVNTVRYEAVNAMLLNEFLKEHRRVEEQRNHFETKIAQQQKQIEVLTAGLQKVTAQVESGKTSVRVAISNE